MTLSEFIEKLGEIEAASLFEVSYFTARAWRQGAKFPSAKKAIEIEFKTRGHELGHIETIKDVFGKLPALPR